MVDVDLVTIGVVRSSVSDRRQMPPQGVPAEVELFEEYEDGLLLIEENTHIWVLGCFDEADRERLQIVRPNYEPARRRRGVFGLRSTTRPNSVSLSVTRLLGREGRILHVDALDLIDGTAVIDIKRYSPGWDCIFSARSSRDRYLLERADPANLVEWEREAANFHGELCAGVVLGARLVQHVCLAWNIMPKDPQLQVTASTAPALLHLADAVQGLTAATLGTGRLHVAADPQIVFTHGPRRLTAEPLPTNGLPLDALRVLEIGQVFRLG